MYMSLSDLRSTKKRSISVNKKWYIGVFRFGDNRKTHQTIISCVASKIARMHVFRVSEYRLTLSEPGESLSMSKNVYVEREGFIFMSPNYIVF